MIEGNDPRGIDVALLVRKDLPLEIKAKSHKNLVDSTTGTLVFSRDLPAYSIYEKGNSEPLLTIFGTHFKSQRDSDGDPRSVKKRTLQVQAASLIISDYEKQFPNVPILISGDFNNDVRTAKEFDSLKEIGLRDAFDISTGLTVPMENRGTHFYFGGNGEATVSQLDANFFNKVAILQKIVKSAQILSFINENGDDYPVPNTYKERERLPSDHRATLLILDLSKKDFISKKQKAS